MLFKMLELWLNSDPNTKSMLWRNGKSQETADATFPRFVTPQWIKSNFKFKNFPVATGLALADPPHRLDGPKKTVSGNSDSPFSPFWRLKLGLEFTRIVSFWHRRIFLLAHFSTCSTKKWCNSNDLFHLSITTCWLDQPEQYLRIHTNYHNHVLLRRHSNLGLPATMPDASNSIERNGCHYLFGHWCLSGSSFSARYFAEITGWVQQIKLYIDLIWFDLILYCVETC